MAALAGGGRQPQGRGGVDGGVDPVGEVGVLSQSFALASLLFLLPAGWSADPAKTSTGPGPIPNTVVKEVSVGLHDAEKKASIYAFWWEPRPSRDGGPMKAARSYTREVAGQKAEVSETEYFFGSKQRVLVTHLRCKTPPAEIMIYARGMDQPAFDSFLDGVHFQQ